MAYEVIPARPDGLFSNLYSVLGAIDWCEEHGGVPVVRFDSGLYLDRERGPNWWEYFFERVSDVDPMDLPAGAGAVTLQRAGEMAFRLSLHRDRTADIIRRHIRVRPEVLQGVDAFWDRHLGRRFVVGVHLRGTDKWLEAPLPRLDELFDYLDLLLVNRTPDSWRLFVATDQAGFLARMRERFGAQVVSQDSIRSEDGHALHKPVPVDRWASGPLGHEPSPPFIVRPPYRIGLECVRDALILARCHAFFGSQSNLSYFVGASNPKLPWIHLGGFVPLLVYREHLAIAECAGRFERLPEAFPSLAELNAKEAVIHALHQATEERGRLIETLHQTAEERGRLIQTLHDAAQQKEQLIGVLHQTADERLRLIDALTDRVRALEAAQVHGQALAVADA